MSDVDKAELNPSIDGDNVRFDRKECIELGAKLFEKYTTNEPFPHIVLDNFLAPDILRRVCDEFPGRQDGRFSDSHSKLKTGYQLEKISSHYITNLLNALNSSQFISFLEALSGIKGLIPDPQYSGAGLHETARGGHLSIHADFNIHPKLKLRRRMNAILFLNDNWNAEYGGALELWDKDMTACQHAVLPEMGTLVVFNTEADSLHGHPDPLNAPDDVFRRSIALYYYTVPDTRFAEATHTTDFKRRPNSNDKYPLAIKLRDFAKDLIPPLLARHIGMK